MGCWWKRLFRKNINDNDTVDAELKIGFHCQNHAEKIRKAVSKLEGVKECMTDIENQKIMVAGEFDLEKVLKILKEKTHTEPEILAMRKKSDVVETEDDKSDVVETTEDDESDVVETTEDDESDDILLTEDEDEIAAEENKESGEKNSKIEENDDKPETSVMVVVYKIISLCDKYEVSIRKVVSKFEGVETCEIDLENQKVVVTGKFDQEKLFKKLKEKMQKKKDEESKIAEEKDEEETETNRDIHVPPYRENEIAKYMMLSDANPNGCSIS